MKNVHIKLLNREYFTIILHAKHLNYSATATVFEETVLNLNAEKTRATIGDD